MPEQTKPQAREISENELDGVLGGAINPIERTQDGYTFGAGAVGDKVSTKDGYMFGAGAVGFAESRKKSET